MIFLLLTKINNCLIFSLMTFSGLEDPKDSIVSVCENGEAFCNPPNKIRCDLFTCSKLNVDTATVTSMLKSRVYLEELGTEL